MKSKKIAFVGKGNVALILGNAFKEAGFDVSWIDSRKLSPIPEADIYIFSVKDDILADVLDKFPRKEALYVHTAGSLPAEIFKNHADRYGVIYPLQTFSKQRTIALTDVPFFVEANNSADENLLIEIAGALSRKVNILSSEKRKMLHLAAVFACNFTNHMYHCAANILEQNGLDYQYLLPLIEETADKIKHIHPKEAQTGPAVRYDKNVINKHLELLDEDPFSRKVYETISQSIYKRR